MYEDLLLGVSKPARYIGKEWNVSGKSFAAAQVRFALCFPDLYEVGMSNVGVRILYGLLNSIEGVVCERFFSPELDMESALQNSGRPILSLESAAGLRDFDLVGFSLGYELNYPNVLSLLSLGGVPLLASERDASYPLIIGGGPCVLNPEPLHEFFDIFVIGEGEEVIGELTTAYRAAKAEFKSGAISKQELLLKLAQIEGVYVPSLYEITYRDDGTIASRRPICAQAPEVIRKRVVKDLDAAYYPSRWMVPYIQVVHDRVCIEIMRGCPNRCRFCQARQQYYPFRQRSLEKIQSLAQAAYRATGYEEISLGGLSVTDYPRITELLKSLIAFFSADKIAVSLPSIKPRDMVSDLSGIIASIKKTALTFAPEAASEKMRQVLGKDFDIEEFKRALARSFELGYQHIKLYFLIGIPGEQSGHLQEIVDFCRQAADMRRDYDSRRGQVNASINALIPKPHTPFQWCSMEGEASIYQKQQVLKTLNRSRNVRLAFHDSRMSVMEAILSRGDRRLSQVIWRVFSQGGRFQASGDHFNSQLWQQALAAEHLDSGFYLRQRQIDEILPWDFLDLGVPRSWLESEYNKAIALS